MDAFDDDVYNAFVPYYPLLTTDTADVYKYSPAKVVRSDEQPTEGVWYKDQKGRYYTYPEDWTKSFYGARDALSNLLTYGDVSEKDKAAAKADYAALQKDIMEEFAEMKAAVAAADTKEAKQAAATTASNKMSEKVYEKTVKMHNKLQKKQEARAWFGSLLNKNS